MPGLSVALAVHALALGALLLIGGENDAATPSDADPILLMLAGDDPDKDAGLVGRERGPARGTEDGDLFDPGEFSRERLEKIREENERLAAEEEAQAAAAAEAAARAERERAAEEKAAREKAAREKTAAEKAARERAAAEAAAKKAEAAKNAAAAKNAGDAKKVDIRRLVNNNRKNGASGKSSGGKSSGGKASGKRVGEVKVGGGNGKAFGTVDGTGGNGGDGGARVADARALYVKAVLKRFERFFDEVVSKEPLSIPSSITVDVRFTVDARGNVRFLDVVGSPDDQVRARVEKIFRLAFPEPFKPPPGGEPFTGRLNGVSFLVD